MFTKRFKFNKLCPIIEKNVEFFKEYTYIDLANNMGTHSTLNELDCPYMMKCGIDNATRCPFYDKGATVDDFS